LLAQAKVRSVDIEAGVARGVVYESEGETRRAVGDLVAVGANGIFNAQILLSSGLAGPQLGKGLVEQASVDVDVYLDGLDNFDGSTSITGHGYNYYSGEHRRDRAAMMLETWNVPDLRIERGRWRQILRVHAIVEDLRRPTKMVSVGPDSDKPTVNFEGPSEYAQRALEQVGELVEDFVTPLPVERVVVGARRTTEAHVLGTTVMGNDPESSVVDRNLVHHQVRNLLVLGGGAFPTAAPANPTLTLSALSLRAADELLGGAHE
jgi:choline dehydrogenase-like flavoprotein